MPSPPSPASPHRQLRGRAHPPIAGEVIEIPLDVRGEQFIGLAPGPTRSAETEELDDPALITGDGGRGQTPGQPHIANAIEERHDQPNIPQT